MSLIETSCRLESGVSCDDDDDVSTKAGFEKRSWRKVWSDLNTFSLSLRKKMFEKNKIRYANMLLERGLKQAGHVPLKIRMV